VLCCVLTPFAAPRVYARDAIKSPQNNKAFDGVQTEIMLRIGPSVKEEELINFFPDIPWS
jgi:hypothetical protein